MKFYLKVHQDYVFTRMSKILEFLSCILDEIFMIIIWTKKILSV